MLTRSVRLPIRFDRLEARRLMSYAPFGTETTVPTFGEARVTDVAVAANGDFLVASLAQSDIRHTIGFVRYRADGTRVAKAAEVASFLSTTAVIGSVSVAVDDDGDAVVAYQTKSGHQWDISYNRISRDNVVSAPVLVDTLVRPNVANAEQELISPSVSMGGNGDFFVGWIAHPDNQHAEVRIRAFDAAGAPRAAAFVADTGDDSFKEGGALDIGAAPDGNSAAFAYTYAGGDFQTSSVRFGRVSTSARTTDVKFALGDTGSTALAHLYAPSVASFADGSFVLAYGELRFSIATDFEVVNAYAERYDPSAGLVGSSIRLASTIGGAARRPAVDAAADGGFVVTYSKDNTDDTATLFAQRFDAANQSDDAGPVDIDAGFTGDLHQAYRSVAVGVDAGGNAVVAYNDEFNTRTESKFRRLTDELAAIDNRTLYVLGTRRSEPMSVKPKGGSYVAARGSAVLAFGQHRADVVSFDAFNGNDAIFNGTTLPMLARGGSGNDTITGGTSNDTLRGNGGDDSIFGGDGDDSIIADVGNDSLRGGEGNDTINGDNGDDTIRGERGTDRLNGGDGLDLILGGPFNDDIYGGSGNDRLYGDADNDTILSGIGADYVRGGDGHDWFDTWDPTPDRVYGDGGRDSYRRDVRDHFFDVEIERFL